MFVPARIAGFFFGTTELTITESTLRPRNVCRSNDDPNFSVGILLDLKTRSGVANASFVNELLMSIRRYLAIGLRQFNQTRTLVACENWSIVRGGCGGLRH